MVYFAQQSVRSQHLDSVILVVTSHLLLLTTLLGFLIDSLLFHVLVLLLSLVLLYLGINLELFLVYK